MFDVAYVLGNFSPFHKGHMHLVKLAAKSARRVLVVTSYSGRENISERAKSMHLALVQKLFPENADLIVTPISPVRYVFERLGEADKAPDDMGTYAIFGATEDLTDAWSDRNLWKYLPNLRNQCRISTIAVNRLETDRVSGTYVRSLIKQGDNVKFGSTMPEGLDCNLSWSILKSF